MSGGGLEKCNLFKEWFQVFLALGIILIMAQWFFFFIGTLFLFNTELILLGNVLNSPPIIHFTRYASYQGFVC